MAANYPAAQFWFNVFQFVFTGLVALYVRRVAKQKATSSRFKTLEEEITRRPTKVDLETAKAKICSDCEKHQKRTTNLESRAAEAQIQTVQLKAELNRFPTQQQMNELTKNISDLNSALQKTKGRLEGINRAVDLINEFLINQGSAKTGAGG